MSLASIAYLIQSIPPTPAGEHLHFCPACYAYVGCADACACPEDLTREDGTPCGSVALCAFCEAEASA